MGNYIENVNLYLSKMKIKQNFLGLKSGIDVKKLSRILNGKQDVNSTDMVKIAQALGQDVTYFLSEDFEVPDVLVEGITEVAFYAGEPTKKQEEFAMQIIELIENADQILGAKERYMNSIGEW